MPRSEGIVTKKEVSFYKFIQKLTMYYKLVVHILWLTYLQHYLIVNMVKGEIWGDVFWQVKSVSSKDVYEVIYFKHISFCVGGGVGLLNNLSKVLTYSLSLLQNL